MLIVNGELLSGIVCKRTARPLLQTVVFAQQLLNDEPVLTNQTVCW